MFEKIKLQNLLAIHSERYILPKVKGNCLCFVKFKRSILEKYFYNFNGICIATRNKGISSTLIVRNVIKLFPLEYTFNRYSPLIFFTVKKLKKFNNLKSKLYFLRKKPAPYSRFNFTYVK